MFVRTAGEADLPAVSALLGVVWHDTYDGLYGAELVDRITRGHHSVAELTKQMRRPRSEFLLADDGKAIAGVAFAAAPGDDARIVVLHALHVLPNMQGRGIGGMLLQEIEDSFFESELLRVEVDARNARAARFFESQGYSQTGSRQIEGSLVATMLVYEKSLA